MGEWQPGDKFIYRAHEDTISYDGDGAMVHVLQRLDFQKEYWEGVFLDGDLVGQHGHFFEDEMEPLSGWQDDSRFARGKVYYEPES